MAGYALAKLRFRGRRGVFRALSIGLILPSQVAMLPLFLMMKEMHLVNTYWGVIIPGLASIFGILLTHQYALAIPDDLLDAARVDGAGEFRIWWQIMMPIVRPSLAAVAIFTFVTSWNDFLWPSLMLHTREGMTLPVGLAALQGFFSADFRAIAAGVTITVVPILLFFIAAQRYFVRGLAGAVKG
jgi:multiple sugar transport system permease protein